MISEKITHLCKLKNVTLRAACQAAGLKYSTLHSQLANDRPIPFSTIEKLSRTLNMPLSYFSEQQPVFQFTPDASGALPSEMMLTLERSINKQAKVLANQGLNISIDDVLDWLVHVDYRLTDFEWIKDRVDLYHPLQKGAVMAEAASIGKNSLASQVFGFSDQVEESSYYEKFAPEDLEAIRLSHSTVKERKYTITDQSIDATVNGTRISGSYRKLIAGVTDETGSPFTLVFCRMIRFHKA